MKNILFYKLKNKYEIKIIGNNIERFIHRLNSNKIDLLGIKYIKYNEVNILIYKNDYDKVLKLKTIYEIRLISEKGFISFKNNLKKNIIFLICISICFIILKYMTMTVFSIKIVHNDKDIRNIISNELKNNGIVKYSIKKSYKEIESIKKSILNKYKDKIEWIEIEENGIEYIVRVQERNIIENSKKDKKYNIVSKKEAIIKEIKSSSGVIIKNINDYVSKGDVIISGEVKLNEELKDTINCEGTIYGEVWYETSIEYPLTYREVRETGNVKNVYSIKFLSKYINLFDFNKYKTSNKKEKILINNNYLPIYFIKLNERETIVIEDIITSDEAIIKAKELGIKKMKDNLKENEYIIKSNVLKTSIKEDKVILKMFFSIYENITDYSEIKEIA